jgi:hypothetical protein
MECKRVIQRQGASIESRTVTTDGVVKLRVRMTG